MRDKRMEELRARLGRMARGEEASAPVVLDDGRRVTVGTGGGGWIIWLIRAAALLMAGVFTLMAPVVTFDCAASAPGTAACTFSTSTAGVRPVASERYERIAHAETTPDGWGIRLLDGREQVLYERSDSMLVGTSMRSLAQRLQAAIEAGNGAPVRGWQWPLPIAVLCTVALLFAASGLIPLIRLARRAVFGAPSPEALARSNGASWAFALIGTAIGAGVFYVAPVVRYQCEAAGGAARCTIERRYLGLVPIERVAVAGIARADASAYTVVRREREREASTGQYKRSTESISTVSFQDRDGKLLFEDQQSGAVGTSARDIADAVNGLVEDAAAAPVRASQVPWVPALFASLALLVGLPTLLALVFGPMLGGTARAVFGVAALIGVLLALVAGWVFVLIGRA